MSEAEIYLFYKKPQHISSTLNRFQFRLVGAGDFDVAGALSYNELRGAFDKSEKANGEKQKLEQETAEEEQKRETLAMKLKCAQEKAKLHEDGGKT